MGSSIDAIGNNMKKVSNYLVGLSTGDNEFDIKKLIKQQPIQMTGHGSKTASVGVNGEGPTVFGWGYGNGSQSTGGTTF